MDIETAAKEPGRTAVRSWLRPPRPHEWAAILVGVLAFALRFLGFRGFANDHYMHLAWSQQLLAGDLPGRDFVDPGMPLTYSLSALAQAISPNPYSELILTTAALGLTAALVCLVVRRLTGHVVIGVIAGLFCIALEPRLYSYPKILVPAITLAVVALYAAQPSWRRAAMLGSWTVIAALFRYDLGLYACAATAAALLAAHAQEPRQLARAVGVYGLAAALVGIPYAAFLQWATGLQQHLAEAVEFARSDQHQLMTPWSDQLELRSLNPAAWGNQDAAVFFSYAGYGVVVASFLLLAARRRHQPPGRTPVIVAGAVLLTCYVAFVLRHSLVARVPDLASVLAMMAAWSLFEVGRIADAGLSRLRPSPVVRIIATITVAAVFLAPAYVALIKLSNIRGDIDVAALTKGWAGMAERAAAVRQNGTGWPWEREWPSGEIPAVVRYLDQCTSPSDRLLLTWAAPEYYYFARRQFAAGHALLLPPRAFTGISHQQRMIARLESQFVPIVLINETAKEEFDRSFGLLASHLSDRYVAIGRYTIYDDSVITVARRRDLHATSTYGPDHWPCGLTVDGVGGSRVRVGGLP